MNEFMLIGTLVQMFPMEETSTGIKVVNFLIESERPFKSSGQSSDLFRVTAFKNVAEDLVSNDLKGKILCIRGRLQSNNYTKDDKTYYANELLAEKIVTIK